MLSQLKRTSAFHGHADAELPSEPRGLSAQEFLEIYAGDASPAEWIMLAQDFLDELDADRSRPIDRA